MVSAETNKLRERNSGKGLSYRIEMQSDGRVPDAETEFPQGRAASLRRMLLQLRSDLGTIRLHVTRLPVKSCLFESS
jgi:hypothetical protein